MDFNRELDFEEALVKLLVDKYGWKGGVLNHPTEADLLKNWAGILYQNNRSIDRLGDYPLTDGEMQQLVEQIKNLRTPLRLNGFINGKTVSIRRDNPDDAAHFGKEVSLEIYDRMQIAGGKTCYQIARQPYLPTPHPLASDRRGDVMLLINGMPLIHVELKRSGVAVGQATNQIEKYMREGAFGGLFSLIQIFVGMEPKEAVYFANPGPDGQFNRDYYFHWADFNNVRVNEWDVVAEKLLSIPMAHQLIGFYSVADTTDGVLKVMRSYQFYAARAIFEKVRKNSEWEGGKARLGGYVWHTTGSGKTLTCFKSAQMIAETKSADKVVFLLDRKELGTQSLRDYRGFAGEDANDDENASVQATENTAVLAAKLKSGDDRDALIVTSIQKMSRIKDEADSSFAAAIEKIKAKRVVFIVDEAHRDVNGDMLITIKNTFPEAMFFGFTGTPKLKDRGDRDPMTAMVFGDELHRYTIADGINDRNVLGFDPRMVLTYKDSDVRREVALEKVHAATEAEALADDEKRETYLKWMNAAETSMVKVEAQLPSSQYDRPEHRQMVVKDIKDNWPVLSVAGKFHALLATASISEAIEYYHLIRQEVPELKITALFDPNVDNNGGGFDKEQSMLEILTDYNALYGMHFTIPAWDRFKKDVASRLAHKDGYKTILATPEKQLNLLIVVDQMLTGFDSKWLNTLYLDKIREEENLIQAFSRTNRLFGHEKPFGSVRYYRKPHTMTKNIEDAIKLYSGDRPFALYVEHLENNLKGMNQVYREIVQLFEEAEIADFERLPKDESVRRQFALKFKQFNDYLDAAKIQGFTWSKATYSFEHEGEGDTLVTMKLDERVFAILAQRYKELPTSGGGEGGGGTDVPFDIDPYLTEIDVGMINADYMNTKFVKFLKCLEQGRVSPEEVATVREELHKTFASLAQEDQKFAEMLLDDIESGSVELRPGMTIQDYIAEYKTKALNRDIDFAVEVFGLERRLLVEFLSGGKVTEANLNEYGRFQRLMESVDHGKATRYLESALGELLSPLQYRSKLNAILSEFLISGGKGEKIPRPRWTPEVLPKIAEARQWCEYLPLYSMKAACGKFGADEEVAPMGWVRVLGLGRTNKKLYVVRASGDSMEPEIHDGQLCVFEDRDKTCTNGEIILAEHSAIPGDEPMGAYAIKKMSYVKDGGEYKEITLHPLNPKYGPIPIPNEGEYVHDFKIAGVYRKDIVCV